MDCDETASGAPRAPRLGGSIAAAPNAEMSSSNSGHSSRQLERRCAPHARDCHTSFSHDRARSPTAPAALRSADIFRAEDCASDPTSRFVVRYHHTNLTLTVPRPSKFATIESPTPTGTARHNAPGMITLPDARVCPNSASLFASHATGSAG